MVAGWPQLWAGLIRLYLPSYVLTTCRYLRGYSASSLTTVDCGVDVIPVVADYLPVPVTPRLGNANVSAD